jgi:hypothetical protein
MMFNILTAAFCFILAGTSSCQATLRCAHSGQNVLVARLYEQRVDGWPLVSDPECARWLQLPVARRRNWLFPTCQSGSAGADALNDVSWSARAATH